MFWVLVSQEMEAASGSLSSPPSVLETFSVSGWILPGSAWSSAWGKGYLLALRIAEPSPDPPIILAPPWLLPGFAFESEDLSNTLAS